LKTSYRQGHGLFRDPVQRNWYLALLLGLLVLPLLVPSYLVDLSLVFIYGLCGLSLMVLAGYTGLVSLGHAAFLGIGAYAHVYFAQDLGLPWVVSVALAAAVTAAAGVLVGLPALRMSGGYLTMSFFEAHELAITFGGVRALDGVSFAVEPGQVFTIILFGRRAASHGGRAAMRRLSARASESHFQLAGFTTFARTARAVLDADRNLHRGRHEAILERIFHRRGIGPAQ